MSEQKPIKVTSRIQSLEMVGFQVEKVEEKVDEKKIVFEIGTNVEINQDKKLITIGCPIYIFADAEKKVKLGLIEVKGEFVIENFSEVVQTEGIPIPVLASFNGVVISAARGMLRILSKGTQFATAVIPIINPIDVFKNFNPQEFQVNTTTPDLARKK